MGRSSRQFRGLCAAVLAAGLILLLGASASSARKASYPLDVHIFGAGTVISAPPGMDCSDNCSVVFPAGSAVTLTATPAAGYYFTGWGSNLCPGTTTTCTVTMNDEIFLSPNFRFEDPPNTEITKAEVTQKSRTAKFAFKTLQLIGSPPATFECSLTLKGKPVNFAPCTTPKIYKHLKPASYVFEVAGLTGGGPDDTPPRKTFVIRAPRKHH